MLPTFLEFVKNKSLDKKRLDKFGDYTVYTVNASAVRDMSQEDDEFNHLATHLEFPKLVPSNEIWISRDIAKKEIPFLIHNGLNQYEAKKKHKKDSYEYALKRERAERQKVDHLKFRGRYESTPPQKVYYKYYCGIPSPNDDIEVWLVDGEVIRDLYKTDFIEGGNGGNALFSSWSHKKTSEKAGGVYHWIPINEIWIEKNLMKDEGEVNITILHEYIEQTLMRYKKMSYDKAHIIAAKVDWHHRGKWKIEDVKTLNREEALKMAKRYL